MAIQPEGGFSGKAGNINAPRQIVIASSNAGMNRVLEEVYWDQSSISRNPGPSVDMPTVGSPVPAKQDLSTPSLILFVFNSLYQASQVLAIAQLTGKRTAPPRDDC